MCEIAVFINENGTSRRIARGIVRASAEKDCVSLLDSKGRVTKVEGTYIVMLDLDDNRIALRKASKN